jgi:EAL domain-containing protein (putative c-di-GMP-specific phosphodiesterase class I)
MAQPDPNIDLTALERIVVMAHRHLDVDAVYIVQMTGRGPVYRAAAGDTASFGIAVDMDHPPEATYCERLAAGEIPALILDADADGRVPDLPQAPGGRTGSFIGAPLRHADGLLYGALCGLSLTPASHLDARDVRLLSMMADSLVGDLDKGRASEQLRSGVERLVEAEDVAIAFQPIVDLQDNRCLGVEALARFPDPFSRPDRTIATAERFGLSLELERLAVRKAWEVIPLLGEQQFVAVNVAPHGLVELARRANQKDDLPLSPVVVEVTEHAAVESYTSLHRQLDPLRKAGLRLAVDDAGAGYASLRHVLELRPDFIKVDRSLIDGIAFDHARRVAVSGFLSLALDLGSTVVAEGIERPADLEAVRDLGLHAVQGYLIAKPSTDLDKVVRWLGRTAVQSVAEPAHDRPNVRRGSSRRLTRRR